MEELQLEIREYLRENMGIYIVIVALFCRRRHRRVANCPGGWMRTTVCS